MLIVALDHDICETQVRRKQFFRAEERSSAACSDVDEIRFVLSILYMLLYCIIFKA